MFSTGWAMVVSLIGVVGRRSSVAAKGCGWVGRLFPGLVT